MNKNRYRMNLFKTNYIKFVRITESKIMKRYVEGKQDLLFFIVEGNGDLYHNQVVTPIEKGDLFVFRPEGSVCSITVKKEPISLYYVEFSRAEVCEKNGKWYVENEMPPFKIKLNTIQKPIVYHCIKELYNLWLEKAVHTSKTQYYFSMIWEELNRKPFDAPYHLDSEKVILRITEYMNKCYPGSFHVEKMAQLSGMSESSFYHHFKKHTSLTPNQFMTKKRMEHACNLLMSSDLKNNEIAEAVGYQDTYYFNRVFKKNVGIPPRKYQKLLKRKIVVLTPAFVGDLIALGVPREYIILMIHEEKQHKHRWGMSASPFHLEQIRKEKPYIIIGTDKDSVNYDNLAEVAPTWLIPYKKKTWREQFIQLAMAIHAKEIALNWLQFYNLKAITARDKILEERKNETILVARVLHKKIRIFGQKRRKVGDLLYRDLQLKAPKSAHGFHFKDVVHLEELNYFNANNILLLDDKNEYRNELSILRGNVYQVKDCPWLNYSALGQEQAINEAAKYFAR